MSRISQKLANRRAEPLQKLIVFRIRQEWFAVPIQFAQKVIPLGLVYGAPQGGISLTRYQDQEIPVIDAEQRIFGQGGDSSAPAEQRHLMIVDDRQGSLIGIPLDSPPTLRRVTKTAFSPIPTVYLAEGWIRCVNALVTVSENEPPFFLLNLDQLLSTRSKDSQQIASSYPQDLHLRSLEAIAEL
jgi:chemotaxis signal transduction protein